VTVSRPEPALPDAARLAAGGTGADDAFAQPLPDAAQATGVIDAKISRVVLFDFDGVLIHGDAFGLFMRERYRRSLLRKLIVLPTVPWLLLGLMVSWRVPVRTLVHVSLLGVNAGRYDAAAKAFAAQLVRRPRLFSRDGLLALRRHQAAGDRVIVVTGCEHTLVSGILEELGLTDLEVLASRLRPSWLGMRIARHNVGKLKLQALAEHGLHGWRLAYSDSSHDIPMLRAAAEAVLVNGTPRLCMKIEKALGRSIKRVEWF